MKKISGMAILSICIITAIVSSAGAQSLTEFNTNNLAVPAGELLPGGPPKDGIPALVDPEMIDLSAADYLDNESRVVVVDIDGDVRAYPIPILNWHEIVNDVIEGTPVAVVYCPLCDSVSVVDRRLDGEVYEFGVSGYLYESNVLMYDRTDDALWSQVGMNAISGPNAGQSLDHLPWEIMTFAALQDTYPEASVLSRDTGHHRNYAGNPYESYFRSGRLMFPISKEDDRLPKMEPVVGVKAGETVLAYPVSSIVEAEGGVLDDRLQNERLLIEADDSGRVSVVELPSEAQVVHTFWFTWAALHPETEIHNEN